MTNRRTFLKMSLAVPVALTVGTRAFASVSNEGRDADFLFIESPNNVTSDAAGPNTTVVRFLADPMELWTEHCLPALQKGAPVFAGITSGYTAFSLSEISRDFGYRLEQSPKLSSVELNCSGNMVWVLRPNGINFRNSQ